MVVGCACYGAEAPVDDVFTKSGWVELALRLILIGLAPGDAIDKDLGLLLGAVAL